MYQYINYSAHNYCHISGKVITKRITAQLEGESYQKIYEDLTQQLKSAKNFEGARIKGRIEGLVNGQVP